MLFLSRTVKGGWLPAKNKRQIEYHPFCTGNNMILGQFWNITGRSFVPNTLLVYSKSKWKYNFHIFHRANFTKILLILTNHVSKISHPLESTQSIGNLRVPFPFHDLTRFYGIQRHKHVIQRNGCDSLGRRCYGRKTCWCSRTQVNWSNWLRYWTWLRSKGK